MRLNKDLNKVQLILNNASYKQDFTINLSESKSRYVVSIKNLYRGTNPSLDFELRDRISKIADSQQFDSIGGFTNIDGEYFLDANLHLDKLEFAMHTAINNDQICIFDNVEKKLIFTNNLDEIRMKEKLMSTFSEYLN